MPGWIRHRVLFARGVAQWHRKGAVGNPTGGVLRMSAGAVATLSTQTGLTGGLDFFGGLWCVPSVLRIH
jgi:hypothetical protein